MSGTSQVTARVRSQPGALFNAENKPVGSIASRLVVANNINHYQDIHGQVRMNWAAVTNGSGKGPYISVGSEDFALVTASRPFPIAIREDGSSYRIRLQIAAAMESGGVNGSIVVTLAPAIEARSIFDGIDTPGIVATDSVWLSDPFSGTGVTQPLTGESQGPNAWETMVYLNPAEVGRYVVPVAGLTDIGGSASSRLACMVSINIFARTQTAGNDVRLYGATCTEWVGS